MKDKKYVVYVGNEVVADNMALDYAAILIKSIFNEYGNDSNLKVTIKAVKQEFWRAD